MNKKFYITTTLPYVNAEPHIGFALEIVQADTIARFHRLLGEEVVFNFGTDEHGLKIYRKALESKKTPQAYCDEYAAKFDDLKKMLNLSYTHFIRTTEPKHLNAAQEFWKRCLANGDIYKKNYKIKYCVGCELEKTDSDLENGRCPFHPKDNVETYEEENYFFKFSRYQKPLLEFYDQHPNFVVPDTKFNEIKTFVKGGLEDFSISRIKDKMPWGVDIPDDPDQVMYVWFDALVNYISTIGWPQDEKEFSAFWPGLQVAGKDNLRQQTAIWQAMLMSANLPNSKQVFIHGFMTIDGQKISKSLGNVISPQDVINKYGTDALRYYLLAKVHPWEDSDFTWEKFNEVYNADLANGLGNLVSRIAKLCEMTNIEVTGHIKDEPNKLIEEFRFDQALKEIWDKIASLDKFIEEKKPWTLEKNELNSFLDSAIPTLSSIAHSLRPFLPETAEKIWGHFNSGNKIVSISPLFPRIKMN